MLDLDAYFARIGYAGPREPTLAVLREIVRLHPAAIAFENLSTLLGWPVPLDVDSLERKLIAGGRGGYCFEHNLLLRHVLEALGFEVRALAARVVWDRGREDAERPLPPSELGPRTHMLLTVRLGAETLLADVGFGGLTLNAPLALEPGREQGTPKETFRLVERDRELTLQARLDGGWRSLYRFGFEPQLPIDIELLNHYIATHPASPMRSTLMAALCADEARYSLRDNSLRIRPADGLEEQRTVRSAAELRDVLASCFGIAVPEDDAVDALLERIAALPDAPVYSSPRTANSATRTR